ncbi:hypothetical protein D3C81_1129290 [compost metagenome]
MFVLKFNGLSSPFRISSGNENVYVDDAVTLVNEMVEAGAIVLNEPTEMFWGDLKARLKDPFGFWDIAQKL